MRGKATGMKAMKVFLAPAIAGILMTVVAQSAAALTVTQWTFETSVPGDFGPFSPESGSGSATGFHAGSSTYSSPSGNGSLHPFSSNTWAVGDYYQFQVSTAGYQDIQLRFDQTSSNTGPRGFALEFGTDGTNFTQFAGYTVLPNGTPHATWNTTTSSGFYSFAFDLSSITALDNASNVYFRLIDVSTVSATGGGLTTAGTDRVDNFTVFGNIHENEGAPVPEPITMLSVFLAATVLGRYVRRHWKLPVVGQPGRFAN